jgi:hypothetical protein
VGIVLFSLARLSFCISMITLEFLLSSMMTKERRSQHVYAQVSNSRARVLPLRCSLACFVWLSRFSNDFLLGSDSNSMFVKRLEFHITATRTHEIPIMKSENMLLSPSYSTDARTLSLSFYINISGR